MARYQPSNIKRGAVRPRRGLQGGDRLALHPLVQTRILPAERLKNSHHFDVG